eukprot:6284674-Pyramimonas_sp.AAC.1
MATRRRIRAHRWEGRERQGGCSRGPLLSAASIAQARRGIHSFSQLPQKRLRSDSSGAAVSASEG